MKQLSDTGSPNPALWDNFEGWEGVGDGKEVQEGGDICIPMTDYVDIQQQPTQYCKAIILQLEIN